MTGNQQIKTNRITSIDALRAVTLLGIIMVHAFDGFGHGAITPSSDIDEWLNWFIKTFLMSKSNTIFSLLFGVSFYLILRNPQNTSGKFLWRCFLLMLIGIVNKVFFTYDALMWYGIYGMMLVPVRYMKPKHILKFFCLLFMATVALQRLKIGNTLFGVAEGNRYAGNGTFMDVLTYPYAIQDYARGIFNHGVLAPYALFVLGYWLAVKGYIEKLEQIVTGKVVLICWVFYLVSFALPDTGVLKHFFRRITIYGACFAYATSVIYLYYHSSGVHSVLRLLEPYGKMGLTNYSMQGIIGVCIIWQFTTGVWPYSLWGVVIVFIGVYLLQLVFSCVWLQYFRYGPLEYLWRAATERKIIKLRVER